ncbi:MAG: tRNA uridine-5-carboxymethylaminomethyl(34) synthesis GTPase MnmE [Ignavibacteria bacterium]|nr:tRNA uridine-5-carboxymethylaminomethyl(34) synthesis GTPase MnmE [Ignavibacteria bacterium]
MIKNNDTICAVITAYGVGAISIVRVSGPKALEVGDRIFVGKHRISDSPTHRIYYGRLINNIDDVLVSVFRKPHSYTGEDSIEISHHGNFLITRKILQLLIDNGVRLAEPGEFTKRAFINGKIDLLQAEAVSDIIQSRSDIAVQSARKQLDGILSDKIKEIKDYLVEVIGLLELELDFVEEDIEFVDKHILIQKIDNIIKMISNLISTYKKGKIIYEGINVLIIGKPNVGKSSLLNKILNDERAIVSDIPGTTRDVIKEEIFIEGNLFRFFDTAGLRKSSDIIEEEGIKRAIQLVEKSDILIHLVDYDSIDENLNDFNIDASNKKIFKVVNKIDLLSTEQLIEIQNKNDGLDQTIIPISAKTGVGIDKLFDLFKQYIYDNNLYSEDVAVITNIRHYNSLKSAKDSLESAIKSLQEEQSNEFVAIDLRKAANSLKELTGEITSEEILNSIFSKFCIGK